MNDSTASDLSSSTISLTSHPPVPSTESPSAKSSTAAPTTLSADARDLARLKEDYKELSDNRQNLLVVVIALAVLWFITVTAMVSYCLCKKCRQPRRHLHDLDGDLLENPVIKRRPTFEGFTDITHMLSEDSHDLNHGIDNVAMTSFSSKKRATTNVELPDDAPPPETSVRDQQSGDT